MPGQILLFSSAEIPAEYPIVPRALPFSLSPASLRQRGLCGGERNSRYKLPHGSGQMALPKRKCFANYMVCGLMKSKCFGRLKVSRAYISQ